jgi:large subunit ribosomal protein L21
LRPQNWCGKVAALPAPWQTTRPAAERDHLFSDYRLMAFAIIKTGGKQYRVSKGDKIDVEKLDGDVGSSISIGDVLFYGDGSDLRIGDPKLSGASVSAKVVDQFRADKVINFKYKRRKGYHRTKGHRRQMTRLQIEAINL